MLSITKYDLNLVAQRITPEKSSLNNQLDCLTENFALMHMDLTC